MYELLNGRVVEWTRWARMCYGGVTQYFHGITNYLKRKIKNIESTTSTYAYINLLITQLYTYCI